MCIFVTQYYIFIIDFLIMLVYKSQNQKGEYYRIINFEYN